MKQAYKKIIAISLFFFGLASAMEKGSLDDIDDNAHDSVNKQPSIVDDSKYKKFLENQIRAGSDNNDPYAVLGVAKKASDAEISAVFRKLSALYHTDKNNINRELIDKITNAKNAISTERNAISTERNLHLGLAYGVSELASRSATQLIIGDVKNATDQIVMAIVIGFFRTKVATPIRRFFIQSDSELEELEKKSYLIHQECEHNNYIIQMGSAQIDALKAIKLEIKTQKSNEKLKARSREKLLQEFGSLQMPPIQLRAAPEENGEKNSLEINAIDDYQTIEQSDSQHNGTSLADN